MTFAEYLLARGVVSPDDLLRCLDYRRWLLPFIGTVAVNHSFLTAAQVLKIVEQCETQRMQFGEAAIEQGLLDADQVQQLLELQEKAREPLSSCLVKLSILTRIQVEDLEREWSESGAMSTAPSDRGP